MTKIDVQTFKALSDTTRLRILLLLLHNPSLCVCDMMASLEIPQSTASRHLSILKNAGFIEGERRGAWMHYHIVRHSSFHSALVDLLYEYRETFSEAQQDSQRLANYLELKEEYACGDQS